VNLAERLRLIVITDAAQAAPRSVVDVVRAAVDAGAPAIQLRDKGASARELAESGRELLAITRPAGALLFVNDRVDVACSIGAFGLHIGQSDGDPAAIRQRIGPDMVLGLSIETEAQIGQVPAGVSYLGVGPIRATGSKPDHAPPMGFDGLERTTARTPLPCMAIGGLSASDVPDVKAAGCDGIAIVSSISRAEDPQDAAREFVTNWSKA